MSKTNEKKFSYLGLGNAKIRETKRGVMVEELSDSSLDGVAINVSRKKEHVFNLRNVTIDKDKAVTISHFGLDYLGRLKCLSQQAIYYFPEKEAAAVAFNSKLLPDRFTLIGKLKGKVVFRSEYITPRNDTKVNWIWLVVVGAVALGEYVLDNISYKSVTTTDENGNQTNETTKDWGGSIANGGGNGDDTDTNEICYQTFEGTEFVADKLELVFKTVSSKCTPPPKLKQIQINTHNIEEFEIRE